jgi:hypothetical protein
MFQYTSARRIVSGVSLQVRHGACLRAAGASPVPTMARPSSCEFSSCSSRLLDIAGKAGAAKPCWQQIVRFSAAKRPTRVESPLLKLAEGCIRERRCSPRDIEAFVKLLQDENVNIQAVLKAARCMQFIKPKDASIALPCMDAITLSLKHCKRKGVVLQMREPLCELLASLKHFSGESIEIRSYVSFISASLSALPAFSAVKMLPLSRALFGLRNMSSDVSEVRSLLSYLSAAVSSCSERFDAQAVGNALYGLQHMSSDVREVRSLLSSLSAAVSSCSEPLRAQAVGNALYGLQCMSSDVPEVRSLLSSLSAVVSSCSEPLDAQAVGNALYGLQCMSSDVPEVRSLLLSLSAAVSSCSEPLRAQEVGNALYGLQHMSSDVPEVRLCCCN